MCYHPNVLVYKKNSVIKKDGNHGIQRIKIIFSNEPNFKGYEHYLNLDKKSIETDQYGEKIRYKLIPCGKCIQCRANERQTWALRMELEAKQYENNYFITLTYNDENIYIPDRTVNKKTGEIFYNDGTWKGTLVKEDLTNFLKSTRKWFERDYNHQGVKFYACGEYGDQQGGARPHYHIILMNTPKLDTKLIQHTKYMTCERLENIWHRGFINIGEANWTTMGYTAGYCQKKLFGDFKEEYYAKKGQLPIYATMSRRPGIGKQYFEENYETIYETDEIFNSKGQKKRPPVYFDRLLDIGNHDVLENLKEIRDTNKRIKLENKLTTTDKTLEEINKIEERTAIDRMKKNWKKGKFINV